MRSPPTDHQNSGPQRQNYIHDPHSILLAVLHFKLTLCGLDKIWPDRVANLLSKPISSSSEDRVIACAVGGSDYKTDMQLMKWE